MHVNIEITDMGEPSGAPAPAAPADGDATLTAVDAASAARLADRTGAVDAGPAPSGPSGDAAPGSGRGAEARTDASAGPAPEVLP